MKYPNRIRERRLALGLTLKNVAEWAGTTPQQIARLENGERRLTDDWMRRIAPTLECEPEQLMTTDKKGPDLPPVIYAPLMSWSQAGRLIDPEDRYEPGDSGKRIPVSHHRSTVVALKVEDRSMDRVAEPGAIIFLDYEDRALVDGKFYVIKADGHVAFRRYRTEPDRFEPYSTEPDHPSYFVDRPVEIIGRVFFSGHTL